MSHVNVSEKTNPLCTISSFSGRASSRPRVLALGKSDVLHQIHTHYITSIHLNFWCITNYTTQAMLQFACSQNVRCKLNFWCITKILEFLMYYKNSSHVTCFYVSHHIWMRHVTWGWVMSHANESQNIEYLKMRSRVPALAFVLSCLPTLVCSPFSSLGFSVSLCCSLFLRRSLSLCSPLSVVLNPALALSVTLSLTRSFSVALSLSVTLCLSVACALSLTLSLSGSPFVARYLSCFFFGRSCSAHSVVLCVLVRSLLSRRCFLSLARALALSLSLSLCFLTLALACPVKVSLSSIKSSPAHSQALQCGTTEIETHCNTL